MDPPAAQQQQMSPPPASPGHGTGAIEDETGEGLLLDDPLVMSMYQTSSPIKPQTPVSSPDSSPVRSAGLAAEESLSDKEFEQMEAAAAASLQPDVSEVKDFSDFGHPNLETTRYEISHKDPFQTPAKAGTKSSDEDEYEVIPQGADVSNLMSMSPVHSFTAADTTIIDRSEELDRSSPGDGPKPVADLLIEEEDFAAAPPPPLPAAAPPATEASGGRSASVASSAHDSSATHSASPSRDPQPVLPEPAPRDSESEPEPEPEPEPDLFSAAPVPAPVPVLLPAPKKTEADESFRLEKKTLTPDPESVTMASADSSSCPAGSCPFSSGNWLSRDGLPPAVADLVFWKDPRKSGIAFGIGLVILLSLACCSVISVVAYTALAALTGTLSFRIYKNILQAVQKTNEGHPFREYLEVEITPSSERVHQVVDVVLKHVTSVLRKMRSVFLVEDIVDSLKFVVLFWSLTYVGAWFNGLTLVILTYLSAFSLPVVYEMHKSQIDQAVGMALKQVQDVVAMVKSKIPFPAPKDKKQ